MIGFAYFLIMICLGLIIWLIFWLDRVLSMMDRLVDDMLLQTNVISDHRRWIEELEDIVKGDKDEDENGTDGHA